MTQTLSVVIPAFNEEKTIQSILDQILQVDLEGMKIELVVINDCSTDRTRELVNDYISTHPGDSIRLIDQEKTGEKGQPSEGVSRKPVGIS